MSEFSKPEPIEANEPNQPNELNEHNGPNPTKSVENSPQLKCQHCTSPLGSEDQYCPECGRETQLAERIDNLLETGSSASKDKVIKASRYLIFIAILFFIGGSLMGYLQNKEAQEALSNLANYPDSYVWPVALNGKNVTVAELRSTVNLEVYIVFGINYFLALVMIGLYFWSKKTPFMAFVTALAIYLAVMVLSGIVDPATIAQGVLIKALVIAALVRGIKAAIPLRHI